MTNEYSTIGERTLGNEYWIAMRVSQAIAELSPTHDEGDPIIQMVGPTHARRGLTLAEARQSRDELNEIIEMVTEDTA